MPQTPDSSDPTPTPYTPPSDVAAPSQSTAPDPINRSRGFRAVAGKPSRRLGLKDHTGNYPDIIKVIPISTTPLSGEEYSKVVGQEAMFKQSTGRYVINPYGLVFNDDEVAYGAEPSVVMQTDAIPTINVNPEKTLSETMSVVQDSGGEWNGIASGGGGGGGSATGTILKVTEVLSANVHRCSVINNSNDQTEILTNQILYSPNNTRGALGVDAVVGGILQSDGSYLSQPSLLY